MTRERFASVRVNDVVQISPTEKHKECGFDACLLAVKSWGVQGFVNVPERGGAVQAYYRVPFDDIDIVGAAHFAIDHYEAREDQR